jgi:NTP pyrophosphatase (non-canonical NTP hydrolase)
MLSQKITKTIKDWQVEIREWALSKGFDWSDKDINTILLRIHSEVSEASEAVRDGDLENLREELADIFIRLADVCELLNIDLNDEVEKKMAKNRLRPYRHGRAIK